jgi:hypothetical protein
VSSAELLYGAALALHGQFLAAEELPVAQILQQLRSTKPLPTRPLPEPAPTAQPKALLAATRVYVRRGAAAGPLAAQYAGPYLVLERGPKVFKLQVGNREEAVSWTTSSLISAQLPSSQRCHRHMGGQQDCVMAAVITGGGYKGI